MKNMSEETTTSNKRHGNQQMDDDSSAMIYQGISITQAITIFGMDLRDIKAKTHGLVKPCGERKGNPIYQIRDLAPYLVKPPYDIDEFIQRMSVADLPMMLRKEYWAGLRSRQLYEKEAAELWPTADVVDMVSTLFKTIRMSLLLTRESVERETELSDRQRAIITRIIDNALEDAHAKTISKFTEAKSKSKSANVHDADDLPEEL